MLFGDIATPIEGETAKQTVPCKTMAKDIQYRTLEAYVQNEWAQASFIVLGS